MSEESIRFKREILGVSIFLVLGSLLIIFPFLDALILAVATSYFLRFGHKKLDKRLDNEFLSSMIITAGLVGFIIIGVYFFLNNFSQILNSVAWELFDIQRGLTTFIENLDLPTEVEKEFKNFLGGSSGEIKEWLRNTLASIPILLINVAIYLVTSIYLYMEGSKLKDKTFDMVENFPDNEEKIIKSLAMSTDSIFRGVFLTQFLVALSLTAITWIGFKIIGLVTTPIPFTELMSILVGLAALLPLVAAFMFYGPLGIYYLASGSPLKGALILMFGVFVINIATELFIRPFIGAKQMNEHPLIIFLGFLAGPLTLGLKGLIVGPLLLILSKDFLLNYSELVGGQDPENRSEDSEED